MATEETLRILKEQHELATTTDRRRAIRQIRLTEPVVAILDALIKMANATPPHPPAPDSYCEAWRAVLVYARDLIPHSAADNDTLQVLFAEAAGRGVEQ